MYAELVYTASQSTHTHTQAPSPADPLAGLARPEPTSTVYWPMSAYILCTIVKISQHVVRECLRTFPPKTSSPMIRHAAVWMVRVRRSSTAVAIVMPGAEARAACARDEGERWRVTWDRRENIRIDVASRRVCEVVRCYSVQTKRARTISRGKSMSATTPSRAHDAMNCVAHRATRINQHTTPDSTR